MFVPQNLQGQLSDLLQQLGISLPANFQWPQNFQIGDQWQQWAQQAQQQQPGTPGTPPVGAPMGTPAMDGGPTWTGGTPDDPRTKGPHPAPGMDHMYPGGDPQRQAFRQQMSDWRDARPPRTDFSQPGGWQQNPATQAWLAQKPDRPDFAPKTPPAPQNYGRTPPTPGSTAPAAGVPSAASSPATSAPPNPYLKAMNRRPFNGGM